MIIAICLIFCILFFFGGIIVGYRLTRKKQISLKNKKDFTTMELALFGKEYVWQNFSPDNKEQLGAIRRWLRENYPTLSLKL